MTTDARVRTAGFVAISGVLMVGASVRGWHVVSGLEWPFDSDHAVTAKCRGVALGELVAYLFVIATNAPVPIRRR